MTGDVIDDDGTLRLVRVHVEYEIRVPPGRSDHARRALVAHPDFCPVARSLTPCVEITWDADIRELDEQLEDGGGD